MIRQSSPSPGAFTWHPDEADVMSWSKRSKTPKGPKLSGRHHQLVSQVENLSQRLQIANGHAGEIIEDLRSKLRRIMRIEHQLWQMSGNRGALPRPAAKPQADFYTTASPCEIYLDALMPVDDLSETNEAPSGSTHVVSDDIMGDDTELRTEDDPRISAIAEHIVSQICDGLCAYSEHDESMIRRCDDLLTELGYEASRRVIGVTDEQACFEYVTHSPLYTLEDDEYDALRRLGDLYMENPPNT